MTNLRHLHIVVGAVYLAVAEIEFSEHARDMLVERQLREEWIWRTVQSPEDRWHGADGNWHFTQTIAERENRILHVVVNTDVVPNRIVTVFFDRRLRKPQ